MVALSFVMSSPSVLEIVRLLIATKADASLQDIVRVWISCLSNLLFTIKIFNHHRTVAQL